MKEKDILEVDIIDDNINGDGIARYDLRIIFVPYTSIGDKVRIQITKVNKSVVCGKVIKLLSPSKYRVDVDCPLFRKCGGCCLLHQSYNHQLDIKRNHVISNFKKIAKKDIKIDKIVSDSQYRYRNKIQLPIGADKEKGIVVGYYKKGTHEIISQEDCLLMKNKHKNIIDIFLHFANSENLTVYDEHTGKGLLRHFMIREIGNFIEIVIVINGNKIKNLVKLYNSYLENGYNNISLSICKNTNSTNVVLDGDITNIYSFNNKKINILGTNVIVSPKSFMQVNSIIRDIMYKDAIELLKNNKAEVVVEAFSGVGIITNVIAKHFSQVYALEIEEQAVIDANRNKEINENSNITNILGDANIEIIKLSKEISDYVLFVDPPRKGLMKSFIDTINETRPNIIIYASCDSATLARDFSMLQGYDIKKVFLYDMFPNTKHVETIVLLSKLDSKRHIAVELSIDEMDLTSAESKTTYKQIQNYVLEKFGFKISTLYIAQVKRKYGLEIRKHYNISSNKNQKIPQCPIEKEEAIVDALKYYKMI